MRETAMPQRNPKSQHLGFKLVELLVVIGIIAILIGILLPTLQGARKAANLLKCQTVMRELGLAMQMYAQTNRYYLPAGRTGTEAFQFGSVQMPAGAYCFWWMRLQQQKLIPGLDDPTRGVAICPSDDTPYWPFQEYPNNKNLQTSYGINPFMSVANDVVPGGDPPNPKRAPLGICDWYGFQQRKITGVKNTAEVILLGEVRQGWMVNWFAPNTFEGAQAGSDWFDWDWYRHSKYPGRKTRGRSNVLWLDGHVSTVNQGSDLPSYFYNDIYSAAWWLPVNAAVGDRGQRQWAFLPAIP
jgi:prepilin-type processing-associated H-X9-DG protein